MRFIKPKRNSRIWKKKLELIATNQSMHALLKQLGETQLTIGQKNLIDQMMELVSEDDDGV